jgi:hypothetical protein
VLAFAKSKGVNLVIGKNDKGESIIDKEKEASLKVELRALLSTEVLILGDDTPNVIDWKKTLGDFTTRMTDRLNKSAMLTTAQKDRAIKSLNKTIAAYVKASPISVQMQAAVWKEQQVADGKLPAIATTGIIIL